MKDYLRMVLISFEFLVPFATWAMWFMAPATLAMITPLLIADTEIFMALLAAPLVMLLPAYKLAREVRFPLSNSHALAQWPDYKLLTRRVSFALSSVVLCSAVAVVAMLTWRTMDSPTLAALTITLLAPSVSAVVSLAFASFVTKRYADELEHIENKPR